MPSARLAWTIWAIGALFYLSGYYLRVSPALMTRELMQAFQVGAQGLGTLSGIFFYFYVAMQVPTGVLVDSVGPRKLLIWGGLARAIGTLLFGTTNHFVVACIGRAIAGGATALRVACLVEAGRALFPGQALLDARGLGFVFRKPRLGVCIFVIVQTCASELIGSLYDLDCGLSSHFLRLVSLEILRGLFATDWVRMLKQPNRMALRTMNK